MNRKRLESHELTEMASLKNWGEPPDAIDEASSSRATVIDCGWGRLLFGQTFESPRKLAQAIAEEGEGRRDVALYVREPHITLSIAPDALFLDPSYTFRLNFADEFDPISGTHGFEIRGAEPRDLAAINSIYRSHSMVPLSAGYLNRERDLDCVSVLVAVAKSSGDVLGVVMGVDHNVAFNDPDNGSSLWALAVDKQSRSPRIGEALVRVLAEQYNSAGRRFMDLSVMHDNEDAIALYEKLGFERVPVYCIKKKNPINEPLFIAQPPEQSLNIYAGIIVDEARRRGITVEVEDAESGLFALSFGGRSISCREALSDLTSAVALSRCDDKALTQRLLTRGGLQVPAQRVVASKEDVKEYLDSFKRVVIKPAQGEQGRGVFVDLETEDEVERAISVARQICDTVVAEQFVEGEDLRVIVIDFAVVAAAVRRPATITGDGQTSILDLIKSQSRRRSRATKGESRIPLDDETERCISRAGYSAQDVLPDGETLAVRKTANLHTGGTIHDVTGELHPELATVAVRAAEIIDIPVVGLDMIVTAVDAPEYYIIEANERPGLANHEPAPTAQRFIDFLFPQSKSPTRMHAD